MNFARIAPAAMKRGWILALLTAVWAAIYLLPGSQSAALLQQGDEPMHAATVQDTLRSGHWLLPQLNGEINYFKPPLLFWTATLLASLAGEQIFVLRLSSFLFTLLAAAGVAACVRLARQSLCQATIAALIYLSLFGVARFSRLLMMEQGMAASLIWTAFWILKAEGAGRIGAAAAAAFFAGVFSLAGLLLKGPVFCVYTTIVFCSVHSFAILRMPGKRFARRLRRTALQGIFLAMPLTIVCLSVWLIEPTDRVREALLHFLIFENLAKFGGQNQSEFRLLGGWLLYSLPWSPLLLGGWLFAFRGPILTRSRRLAAQLAVAVLLLTLLHFLPDRKDSYYVVPFLPAALTAAILQPTPRWPQWLWRAGWAGAFAIFLFHVGLLPILSRPLLPTAQAATIGSELCLVSRRAWDAYLIRMYYPRLSVWHASSAASTISCADGVRPILIAGPSRSQIPDGYHLQSKWPLWLRKSDASSSQMNLSALTETAGLFRPGPQP
ncbi:MAG: glycosyltransferase family 39 protein [Leptospirales bacterium]|nr:glycosyltransferase family 39 protein [Leptospirales bacterium]